MAEKIQILSNTAQNQSPTEKHPETPTSAPAAMPAQQSAQK